MSANTLTPSRPTWNDEMRKELAEIVGKEVNEWCNDETPLEDCIESADKVLRFHSDDDGYELAKAFEDEGFTSDMQFCEVLDRVSYDKSNIIESHVKKWVLQNNLQLVHTVGETVVANLVRQGPVECEVVKLYPETMQYGLWHHKLSYEKGKGHLIVNYECIESRFRMHRQNG